MEPIYEYVKGEGWKPIPRHNVVLRCDTNCSLERRTVTSPGERYFVFYRWRDFEYVKDSLKQKRLADANYRIREEDPDYYYYVVTPL